MYAAAGGASLASRQARQRQRQQNKKNNALLQQQRLAAAKVTGGISIPTRVQPSRQFHQLPSSYLRTPQAQARKLSASYATQSKLLLPICESNGHPNQQEQHVQHQLFEHEPLTRPVSPKLCRQHEKHQHLTKSATATFPLVSQTEATPPATPQKSSRLISPHFGELNTHQALKIQIPADSIIVTPATPLPSPHQITKDSGTTDNIPGNQLERKCSFYRVRKTDTQDQEVYFRPQCTSVPINAQQLESNWNDDSHLYGLPNGCGEQRWIEASYCEQGICSCEHIECAQGKAAWLERGRRCSVQDNNPASCHRRWVKRNRVFIQESSLGGSSDDEDLLGVLRGPSSFANAFLYVGLGTVAIGLVIAFVGTGEKGFKTVELRLIGPSLIGIGLICCILRICFCICPSHCLSSKKARKKNGNKVDADHTTSLLRGDSKRISIARGHQTQKFALTHKTKGNNKMLNEGMEALRQIATTSLFLQNEQKPVTNRIVPIIKEPEKQDEAPLEMVRVNDKLNVCDISDEEDEEGEVDSNFNNQRELLVRSQSKLARQRLPVNQQKINDCDIQMETPLVTTNIMLPSSECKKNDLMPSSSPVPEIPVKNMLDDNLIRSSAGSSANENLRSHLVFSENNTKLEQLSSAIRQSCTEENMQAEVEPKTTTTSKFILEASPAVKVESSTPNVIPQPLTVPHNIPPIETELVLSPAKLGQ